MTDVQPRQEFGQGATRPHERPVLAHRPTHKGRQPLVVGLSGLTSSHQWPLPEPMMTRPGEAVMSLTELSTTLKQADLAQNNRDLLAFLKRWLKEPDDLAPEKWAELDSVLSENRIRFDDPDLI